MFIITVNNEKHVWGNSKQDDFLRFVPECFKISHTELGIELIPDEVVMWVDSPNKSLDFSVSGFVQKKIDGINDGNPIPLIPVVWPYDDQMNFLGIP